MKQLLLYSFLIVCSTQVFAIENTEGNTGVENEQSAPIWDAKIYPNPNNGVFSLRINGNSGALDVLVFNVIGEKVFELQDIGNNGAKINLAGLEKGLYIVQILDIAMGEVVTRRMHIE